MNPLNSKNMKNKILFIVAITCFTISVLNFKMNASNFTTVNYASENAINFVENGITFSIFKNGEFDFYLNSRTKGVTLNYNGPNASISFNAGYNYEAYVQYDQFGAVIQIENTPVYYDQFGRISQVGIININYNHGRLMRVGGLYLHYNFYGNYAYNTGYINHYNRNYIYHAYHNWFIRPYATYSIVRMAPYRHHYKPHRYQYYNDHRYAYKHKTYHNGRDADKRRTYHKKYNNDRQHKKNYVSNDYRRKESSARRLTSSSGNRYSAKNKSKHGSYNKMNSNTNTNKRTTGLRPNSNSTSQQGRKSAVSMSNYKPRSRASSQYRQAPKRAAVKQNERSRTNKVTPKSNYKRSTNQGTSKRSVGTSNLNQRPKNVHLKNMKRRKVVNKGS
jgi:hypothetical protein